MVNAELGADSARREERNGGQERSLAADRRVAMRCIRGHGHRLAVCRIRVYTWANTEIGVAEGISACVPAHLTPFPHHSNSVFPLFALRIGPVHLRKGSEAESNTLLGGHQMAAATQVVFTIVKLESITISVSSQNSCVEASIADKSSVPFEDASIVETTFLLRKVEFHDAKHKGKEVEAFSVGDDVKVVGGKRKVTTMSATMDARENLQETQRGQSYQLPLTNTASGTLEYDCL